MTPKEILQEWIDCFNAADAVALANLYAQDAINHQVANTPVIGKTAIHKMFVNEFATSKMVGFSRTDLSGKAETPATEIPSYGERSGFN